MQHALHPLDVRRARTGVHSVDQFTARHVLEVVHDNDMVRRVGRLNNLLHVACGQAADDDEQHLREVAGHAAHEDVLAQLLLAEFGGRTLRVAVGAPESTLVRCDRRRRATGVGRRHNTIGEGRSPSDVLHADGSGTRVGIRRRELVEPASGRLREELLEEPRLAHVGRAHAGDAGCHAAPQLPTRRVVAHGNSEALATHVRDGIEVDHRVVFAFADHAAQTLVRCGHFVCGLP